MDASKKAHKVSSTSSTFDLLLFWEERFSKSMEIFITSYPGANFVSTDFSLVDAPLPNHMIHPPYVHFFLLLSTVISLLEWSFSLGEMMNRFLGFTPATDGCDWLLWSIRVQRIYVYCISITDGKWISLRNGFGHEADGGSSEAIIFHDATKSGIWTVDIIFLGTHTIWCWNFDNVYKMVLFCDKRSNVNCVVAWHLGVWDRRLELVVGFEPENAGRHVRLSAQHL